MKPVSVSDILKAAGGTLLCGNAEAEVSHISIDSRDVPAGTLFVPIVGEKVDAHRFLPDVVRLGAAAALTAEKPEEEGWYRDGQTALILVGDTLRALQDLGAWFRREHPIPIVGITGSVGKTTTREMVAAALSAGFRTYKTPGNSNSQIGVPLTLSEIGEDDEIAVIEMGMSIPGEMPRLSRMVRPDAAIMTNIGDAHIQQLGSREGILREKAHITDDMPDGGRVFLNADDPLLRACQPDSRLVPVWYGTDPSLGNYAKDIRMVNGCASFTAVVSGKEVPVSLSVYGKHQVLNAMAALSAADAYGVPLKGAAEKLGLFRGFKHRQQVLTHNGVTVIDDSYNASPASMKAALDILKEIGTPGKRIAVLADMKELGPDEKALHLDVGRYIADGDRADVLLTLGDLAKEIARGFALGSGGDKVIRSYDTIVELEEALHGYAVPGSFVLFKGSNSMKLSAPADRMSGNAE